ncbi:histone deacetylase family protein [Zeaxanthinibacter enoshimensis]|uniref:Acetoin utilization deacetylase AcuC-like enzyme n=1 Tax=Zeaxanthinibacter enoshimensis TaxID=392009 RepID=A0A4R6TSA8_9FLAO|nr:histone deacetylase [Zeaxanthinibacter enoshimensis]TDQ33053.1 acetoin utilization deacetylase AcuC-like enzyme [Zeaxanthinibacter enoshimensis]
MIRIAHHPIYAHPLPEGHRFPMLKYDLLPEQLVRQGTCTMEQFFSPEIIEEEHVFRAHKPEYYRDLVTQQLEPRAARKIGFPLSAALVKRELMIAQGTLQGCLYALKHGIAFNIAGGTHHAFSDRGEAFCLLNDQAIAAQYLLHSGKAAQILIIDLDVHQGNGTAEIFRENSSVFTFSVHGKSNYPFRKEESDLDIALPDNTDDETYLSIIGEKLPELFNRLQPDFVFYLCGVDVLAEDKLGRLGLSMEGARKRDELVLSLCHARKVPVQCSMGGGYAPDIRTIVNAHANTYQVARDLYE